MYVRDHDRPALHSALGLDPTEYDFAVFRITSEISKQVFPLLLDIDNPAFLEGLRRVQRLAVRIEEARRQGGLWGRLRTLGLQAQTAVAFLGLYLLPPKQNTLPAQARRAAAW
jgi:magnesium-protoporphyrin IX monomethyl ester (oxidative) cyclase